MGADNLFLYFLLLISLLLAWYSGYRTQLNRKKSTARDSDRDYFIGLNYLLNDEPDQSLDTFISALEVSTDTLESHLALGTLLRRRGKVDGSIAVYQKLLANTQLEKGDLDKVKLGLVKSYVAAGLLDRAERLIDELKVASFEIQHSALEQGLAVYQLEKEWHKAIMVADDLLKVCPPGQRQAVQHKASHFYCELAEREMELEHYNQARKYLNKAIGMDKNNVRTGFILGRLEFALAHYKQAIKALQKIAVQDSAFKAEPFELLIACYEAAGHHKDLQRYIDGCLHDNPTAPLLLKIVAYIKQSQGPEEAERLLLQQLEINPAIELLGEAILLGSEKGEDSHAELFNRILNDFLLQQARYQCLSCGFELRKLHWLCPGCNEWGNVKPIALKKNNQLV